MGVRDLMASRMYTREKQDHAMKTQNKKVNGRLKFRNPRGRAAVPLD